VVNTHSLRFRLASWYAALLAGTSLILISSVYLGFKQNLDRNLRKTLIEQSSSIGKELLPGLPSKGPAWLAKETVEAYAPESNGYFIRISERDGRIVYLSGPPKDNSFDPSRVPPPAKQIDSEYSRNVRMSDGHRLLIQGMVFKNSNGSRYLVESGVSYQREQESLHGLLVTVSLFMPPIILFALGAGYWLMRQSLKPVDEITRRARGITSTNLSDRLPVVRSRDEIERLSTALNEMIGRLEAAFEHATRFTADASHELRTPLTILQLELEGIVQHHRLAPELVDQMESALEESHRLSRIVEDLLVISRLDVGSLSIEKRKVDLGELVASTTEPMKLLAEEKSLSLQCKIGQNIYVEGDRSHLKQLILNLLDNAIKYTPTGGEIVVEVTESEQRAVLEVADSGVGISSDALPHIFKRFYRADKARSRNSGGTGLGLAIISAICGAHNGNVSAVSKEGIGSCFRVELPLLLNPVHGSSEVSLATPTSRLASKAEHARTQNAAE
jgi:two-component system OmpR family sensor kinase